MFSVYIPVMNALQMLRMIRHHHQNLILIICQHCQTLIDQNLIHPVPTKANQVTHNRLAWMTHSSQTTWHHSHCILILDPIALKVHLHLWYHLLATLSIILRINIVMRLRGAIKFVWVHSKAATGFFHWGILNSLNTPFLRRNSTFWPNRWTKIMHTVENT